MIHCEEFKLNSHFIEQVMKYHSKSLSIQISKEKYSPRLLRKVNDKM